MLCICIKNNFYVEIILKKKQRKFTEQPLGNKIIILLQSKKVAHMSKSVMKFYWRFCVYRNFFSEIFKDTRLFFFPRKLKQCTLFLKKILVYAWTLVSIENHSREHSLRIFLRKHFSDIHISLIISLGNIIIISLTFHLFSFWKQY